MQIEYQSRSLCTCGTKKQCHVGFTAHLWRCLKSVALHRVVFRPNFWIAGSCKRRTKRTKRPCSLLQAHENDTSEESTTRMRNTNDVKNYVGVGLYDVIPNYLSLVGRMTIVDSLMCNSGHSPQLAPKKYLRMTMHGQDRRNSLAIMKTTEQLGL